MVLGSSSPPARRRFQTMPRDFNSSLYGHGGMANSSAPLTVKKMA
jgi:hypothetical protein